MDTSVNTSVTLLRVASVILTCVSPPPPPPPPRRSPGVRAPLAHSVTCASPLSWHRYWHRPSDHTLWMLPLRLKARMRAPEQRQGCVPRGQLNQWHTVHNRMSKDTSLAQQPSRMHFTLRRRFPRGCRPRRHRAPLHSHLAASLNCQPAPPPPLQALRLFVALPALWQSLSSSAIPLELHVLFVYQPRLCGCGVERDRSDISTNIRF